MKQKAKEYITMSLGGNMNISTLTLSHWIDSHVSFANSLNPLDVKIDEDGNVLSEPVNNNELNESAPHREYLKSLEVYSQAQTITERLKSDKEKFDTLLSIASKILKEEGGAWTQTMYDLEKIIINEL